VVEGIIYRYRCGIAWRDLPEDFGPWQTVWKRHRAWAEDGVWDQVLDALLVRADDEGKLDWSVAVDSTICRAHQHGTNLERTTGGTVEPQESPRCAGGSRAEPLSRRAPAQDPPARRRPRPAAGDPLWPRPGRRFTDARPATGRPLGGPSWSRPSPHPTGHAARRQGLLLPRHPFHPPSPRDPARDPRAA